MKATQWQINRIANAATFSGDAGERSAAETLGIKLFPESADEIRSAIMNHPVNLEWHEYIMDSQNPRFALDEMIR